MPRRKTSEIETSNSEFMTTSQFQEQIIPWSVDTIKNYIESEGFPAIKSRGGFIFDRKAVREWFKKHEHQAS